MRSTPLRLFLYALSAALSGCVIWVSGDAVDPKTEGPIWVPIVMGAWLLAGAVGGAVCGVRLIGIALVAIIVTALGREIAGGVREPLRFMTWIVEVMAFVLVTLVGSATAHFVRRSAAWGRLRRPHGRFR